jgi:MOSC domain-containing protein YiiM
MQSPTHRACGGPECRGIELCEPCLHLQSMTKPGIIDGLVHRAGLIAEILVGGELRPGDLVEPIARRDDY